MMNFRVKFIDNTETFEPQFIEEDMIFKSDFGEFHTIDSNVKGVNNMEVDL